MISWRLILFNRQKTAAKLKTLEFLFCLCVRHTFGIIKKILYFISFYFPFLINSAPKILSFSLPVSLKISSTQRLDNEDVRAV